MPKRFLFLLRNETFRQKKKRACNNSPRQAILAPQCS